MKLTIVSQGEIDPRAFTLVGLSTKRDDETTIGRWGSGAKGAIAGLLREGVDFSIYSGTRKLQIETREDKFRDKEYKQILVDGEPTSLTTDMHPNWTLIDFVRELYANALDEGKAEVVWDYQVTPKAGYTVITLESDGLWALNLAWNQFFLDYKQKPLFDLKGMRVYQSNKPMVYCKGMWVLDLKDLPKNIQFSYDFDELYVREDRRSDVSSIEDAWKAHVGRANAKEFAKLALIQHPDSWEYEIMLDSGTLVANAIKGEDKFVILAGDYKRLSEIERRHAVPIPSSYDVNIAISNGALSYKAWRETKGYDIGGTLSSEFKSRLETVATNVRRLGYVCDLSKHYYAHPADQTPNVLAFVYKDKVFWTEQGMAQALPELFCTLLEEIIHLEKNHGDYTRQMQDHLLRHIQRLL